MALKHRQLARLAADIETSAIWLKKNAQTIARRAHNDTDGGFGSGAGTGRSSGPNKPTERKALSQARDEVAIAARRLNHALEIAAHELRIAQAVGSSLLALPETEAHALATFDEIADDQKRSVECANPVCGALVARTPNDRLRSGRCEPCYRYRRRTGLERPRPLCDLDPKPATPTVNELVNDPTFTTSGDTPNGGDMTQQRS
jgi:hypothetical protein